MNILYAVLLGILQGVTEFLPISSSGHLVLAEAWLGLEEAGLSFDVTLHLGTFSAVLIYFRQDLWHMARSLWPKSVRDEELLFQRRLAGYLCLATMPAVAAGLLLDEAAATVLRQPVVVAGTLAAAGLLLLAAEKLVTHRRPLKTITMADAMVIGLLQAAAIVPGVSRSGITMTGGLFRGLNRMAVTRFSFLLSAPIILGAGLYKLPESFRQWGGGGQFWFYAAGFLAAALSGYLCIAFLLRFVQTRGFDVFVYYRLFLAGLVLLSVAF